MLRSQNRKAKSSSATTILRLAIRERASTSTAWPCLGQFVGIITFALPGKSANSVPRDDAAFGAERLPWPPQFSAHG